MNTDEQKLEQFIDMRENMDDDTLTALTADDQLLHASVDAMLLRSYLQRKAHPIDVEKRLRAFHKTHGKRHLLRKTISIIALAACLTAGIIMVWNGQKDAPKAAQGTVFTAQEQDMLHLSIEGEEITQAKTADNIKVISQADYQQAKATNGNVELYVPYGESATVTLPDGSIAYMHSDSKISFPAHFTGKERRVTLEGEAYFKVTHDSSHPFIVKAGDTETKVLGTEFNVRSESKGETTVTLISGSVEVSSGKSLQQIVPGEQIKVDNRQITSRNVDTTVFTNWRDGYLYFDNVDMVDMLITLGKNFNRSVIFNKRAAMTEKMHFVVSRNASINEIMEKLNTIGSVKAHMSGNAIVVD